MLLDRGGDDSGKHQLLGKMGRGAPPWSPPLRPLLIVAPHPDDETLGAGGLLSAWAGRGLPVTVLSVSDGETACPEVPELAEIRHAELTRALRALGFEPDQADVIRLGLPDGKLEAYEQRIAERSSSFCNRSRSSLRPSRSTGIRTTMLSEEQHTPPCAPGMQHSSAILSGRGCGAHRNCEPPREARCASSSPATPGRRSNMRSISSGPSSTSGPAARSSRRQCEITSPGLTKSSSCEQERVLRLLRSGRAATKDGDI